MAKKKIKPGQVFKHLPTGGTYLIVTRGQIKIPHVGWFKSVTYKDAQGNHYTRFLEDFENKFIRKPKAKEVPEEIVEVIDNGAHGYTEAANIVTKPV